MKHSMRLIAPTEGKALAYCTCGEVGPYRLAVFGEDSWMDHIQDWFWDHRTADTFDTKPQMEVPFP